MDMMDQLTEKFALELDVPLSDCTRYAEVSKGIHDYAKIFCRRAKQKN